MSFLSLAAMSMLNTREESTPREIIRNKPRKDPISSNKRVKLEKDHREHRRANLKSETVRKIITCAPDNDNYQWRKYGEKKICNSIFSRCYYRCNTYSGSEQNCPAKKQVQQEDQDQSLYSVSYQGNHTCNPVATPKYILDSNLKAELGLISYESTRNQHTVRMTISGFEPCDSHNASPDWSELEPITAKEQSAEGSNSIDDSVTDWDIYSFDLEYGELELKEVSLE